MTNLPISSKYVSRASEAVSDEEREQLAEHLNKVFTAGQVSAYEYEDLLKIVFDAETLGDLLPVVSKLPARQTYNIPAIVEQKGTLPPGEVSKGSPGTLTQSAKVAIGLGGALCLLAIVIALLVVL